MKPNPARIADLWCRFMHKGSMWPAHGHYECRTCGRRHRVCWEEPWIPVPQAMVSPDEPRAQGALVTAIEPTVYYS